MEKFLKQAELISWLKRDHMKSTTLIMFENKVYEVIYQDDLSLKKYQVLEFCEESYPDVDLSKKTLKNFLENVDEVTLLTEENKPAWFWGELPTTPEEAYLTQLDALRRNQMRKLVDGL